MFASPMIILVLLIAYDSIPPLPDLSELYFAEPVLWAEPVERFIMLDGYAGQFGGIRIDTKIPRLDIGGALERKNIWDSTETDTGYISYSMRLPRMWFNPRVSGYSLTRGAQYQVLAPGLNFTVFSSFAVLASNIDYYRWSVDGSKSFESEGRATLIFDRTKYLPSLAFSGRYTNNEFKPELFGQLHIGRVHLTLGSTVTNVVSPLLRVAYTQPTITIAAQTRGGVKFNTLHEYFRPEIPMKYTITIPDETLRVNVDVDAQLDLYHHSIALHFSYNDWCYRLIPADDYQISYTNDTREINMRLRIYDFFQSNVVTIRNRCNIHYNWSDSTISFLPEYAISDTIDIFLGLLEVCTGLCYVSSRPGIYETLPHYYIVNTDIGLRIKHFKPYFSVLNLTDTRSEIFDDYYLVGRQYAGGLHVNWRF